MPTRNVNLTDELDRFVAKRLRLDATKTPVRSCAPDCGLWSARKQQYEAKLAALRAAIDEGDGSGVAEG